MVDYLIEIIFKSVQPDMIGSLLKEITFNGDRIVNYNFTCNCSDVEWNSEMSINKIFVNNKSFGLFINIKELNKNGISLPNCGIAIYKNDETIDLEINFQLSDLKKNSTKDFVKKLMELAKSIAVQYQIEDYFCGIEPAQEAETRLFTNEQLGPFSIEI